MPFLLCERGEEAMGEGLFSGSDGAGAMMHGGNGEMSGVAATGETAASPLTTTIGAELAGLGEAAQAGVRKIIDIVRGEYVTPAGIRYSGPGTTQHIISHTEG